jgi:large subunit ribosomal protein L18
MSKSKTFTVKLKRKRKGKTDYKSRLKFLKSNKTRITIRPSTKDLIIQAVNFVEGGDKVLCAAKATDLKKIGWDYNTGNVPSAYLVGLYFGSKNKDKVKEAIIDLGRRSITKGDRLAATIKGLVDSGINIPHSDSIFPAENKINGTSIVEYAKSLSNEKEKYEKQFSKYLKNKQNPENITGDFEKIKKKILEK